MGNSTLYCEKKGADMRNLMKIHAGGDFVLKWNSIREWGIVRGWNHCMGWVGQPGMEPTKESGSLQKEKGGSKQYEESTWMDEETRCGAVSGAGAYRACPWDTGGSCKQLEDV